MRRLIDGYLATFRPERPLGIAIFGRSRQVASAWLEELLRSIPGAKSLRSFEVDISVIDDNSQLNAFFSLLEMHSTNGLVPIGIVHDFDSQSCKWLRYFLGPLADGVFTRESNERGALGPCIFIFSTSSTTSFDVFAPQHRSADDSSSRNFHEQKGPDFVSRIRGHVDDVRPAFDESSQSRVQFAIRAMSERLALEIARDPEALMHIHDRHLEEVLAQALDGIGFDAELGRGTKDGGKDIVLIDRQTNAKYVVEIKHWRSRKKVSGDYIADFVRVVERENAAKGLFLSSSDFAPNAYEVVAELTRKKVHLGGHDKIVHLCRTYANHRAGIAVPSSELTRVLFLDTN